MKYNFLYWDGGDLDLCASCTWRKEGGSVEWDSSHPVSPESPTLFFWMTYHTIVLTKTNSWMGGDIHTRKDLTDFLKIELTHSYL